MIILCVHTLNLGELREPESLCGHQTMPVLTQATDSCVQPSNWPDSVAASKFHGQSPQLTQLANMRDVHEITLDFCAFGTKWRRRTTFMAGHVYSADVYALNKMRCYGRTRCTFTNKKHMQLVGYDFAHRCSRTHRAKTYPTELAGRLGHATGEMIRPTVQSLL